MNVRIPGYPEHKLCFSAIRDDNLNLRVLPGGRAFYPPETKPFERVEYLDKGSVQGFWKILSRKYSSPTVKALNEKLKVVRQIFKQGIDENANAFNTFREISPIQRETYSVNKVDAFELIKLLLEDTASLKNTHSKQSMLNFANKKLFPFIRRVLLDQDFPLTQST